MSTVELRGPSKLGGPQAWLVWCIAVTFVVYYFSFQTGYAIANSSVQKDIGLSVAQVGLIAAIYTWVFALCQFMSGPLLDRLGARKVLLPAILLVTLGIFAFANAKNFEMLLLSQALIAIGACTGFVGAGYVGGKWFGMAKFSFMFGLVQFAASLFSAFNQNLLNWALSVFQWHELFNYEGGFRHRPANRRSDVLARPGTGCGSPRADFWHVSGQRRSVTAQCRAPATYLDGFGVWSTLLRRYARARCRVGSEAVDGEGSGCRYRQLGGVVPVAGARGGLFRRALVFGLSAAAQVADFDWHRDADPGSGIAALH